jgi:hypothetical protein
MPRYDCQLGIIRVLPARSSALHHGGMRKTNRPAKRDLPQIQYTAVHLSLAEQQRKMEKAFDVVFEVVGRTFVPAN